MFVEAPQGGPTSQVTLQKRLSCMERDLAQLNSHAGHAALARQLKSVLREIRAQLGRAGLVV
jgi:hypothetical protein